MARRKYEGSPWPENDDKLREAWFATDDDGFLLKISEIGRRLGLRKNQIIGRATKMGLPRRPNPVGNFGRHQGLSVPADLVAVATEPHTPRHHNGSEVTIKRIDADKATITMGKSALPQIVTVTGEFGLASHLDARTPRKPSPQAAPKRAKEPPPVLYGRVTKCAAVTDSGRFGVGITYCEDPTLAGKSYCGPHCAAYFTGPPPAMRPPSNRVYAARRAETIDDIGGE